MLKKTVLTMVTASSLAFAQNQIDLNINDDTLEIGGQALLNGHYNLRNDSDYILRAQYLTNEDDNNNDLHMLNADFRLMSALPSNNGLAFGMGLKGFFADSENFDTSGIALSAYGEFVATPELSFDAQVHYGPDILVFGDADRYTEYRANVNYRVVQNGIAFVGYRNIETEINTRNVELDDSAYVGMKFLF